VTFSGYDAFDDPYYYKGTNCLKNRLGLRDPALLEALELETSSLRSLQPMPAGRFNPAHYRRVHRHLFTDVYRWAGNYRTVRTAKAGNWFCYPEYIAGEMNRLLERLGSSTFQTGVSVEDFLHSATEFLAELNAIHAFREGNGRTQLAFLHLVAERAGHPLDLTRVRLKTFLPAMIESFRGDLKPLQASLRSLLS
jgi:cell filamentation protein